MAPASLWLYSVLVWLAQPLVRRKLRRRARSEPGYGEWVGERFGRYPQPIDSLMLGSTSTGDGGFVWIHAVSLGETRAAAVLVRALRAQWPEMRLLLTHGTATGRLEGEKLLQPGDVQVWQPWDTRGAVRRFLRQFHPVVGILIETEVWPNLVAGCRAHGVPLVLANARLSEKSLAKARRVASLSRQAYAGLSAVWPQTDADAARFERLGAPVQSVLGNLKFDAEPDAYQLEEGRTWRRALAGPVLMLASSREGEELEWLRIFMKKWAQGQEVAAQGAIESEAKMPAQEGIPQQVQGAEPRVHWLIVPRHPQRFDSVYRLLTEAGLRVARRSQWGSPPQDADVWLGDTLGEMALYYGLADVALLGGSFAPLGGQNLIEAAACACPVVLGPHAFNFAEAAEQASQAGAALQVANLGEGMQASAALAQNSQRLSEARRNAAQFAQVHRGAAQRTALALAKLLAQRG